jgi:hypothetical protein
MKKIYTEDDITQKEGEQLSKLNIENINSLNAYPKLVSDGEFERYNNVRMFLNNPKEMRKHQRKKKSTKSNLKISKKCKCK